MPVLQVVNNTPTPTPTSQLNYREMLGEVLFWNPDVSPALVGRWVQNTYREIIDSRLWYGLLVKGQVTVPNAISGGTVQVQTGDASVFGTGTAFTDSMVGSQFRVGYTYPSYTIIDVDETNQILTLDLAWGGASSAAYGYQIFNSIVSCGNNIKMIMAMINQQQGYRLILQMPQEVLNTSDAWRSTMGWTFMLTNYIPSQGIVTSQGVQVFPTGVPLYELYPAPTSAQAFPFLAYTQPADLGTVNGDEDTPVLGIASDCIVKRCISTALLWGGKNSKYYDSNTAAIYERKYQERKLEMEQMDNNCSQKDLIWEFNRYPLAPVFGSGLWNQSHEAAFWPG